jgi:predicted metalloprotease with PDZ domain
MSGKWEFSDEQLADLLSEILRAQRDFFEDHSQEYFLVTGLPIDLSGTKYERGSFTGGTSLFQSFAMFLKPGTPLETEADLGVKHLLAHELFHNWNATELIEMPGDERLAYWFSEGFTDHFTREILLGAELITDEQYLNDLNEQLHGYQTNPLRDISNEELAEQFWTSRHAQKLAYQRGAVIALVLDRTIRERSGGASSLADVMRKLHQTEQPDDAATLDYILDSFAEFAGDDYADKLRSHIVNGVPVELRADALGPCYERAEVTERQPRWGLDLDATLSSKEVIGVVAGSAAAEAGLSDGQRLLGFEQKRGEESTEFHLKIETEDGAQTRVLRPRWQPVTTHAFELSGECD